MNAPDVFRTAWDNIGRRRVRTILSATGVTVGIVVLVAMVSFGVGVRRETTRQFEQIGLEWVEVRPSESPLPFLPSASGEGVALALTASLVKEWEQRPDVTEVRTTIRLPGNEYTYLNYQGQSLRISLREDPLPVSDPFTPEVNVIAGRTLRPGKEGEVVLSQDVVMHLGVSIPETFVGSVVVLELCAPRGDRATFSLAVVGITDAPYWEVRVGSKDRQKLKEWWFNETDLLETEGYDSVSLRADSVENAIALSEELETTGYDVRTTKMRFDLMRRGFLIMEALLGSVGLIALLVAGIGIANTMVMATYERTREIGLLKALGASRGEIRAIFVTEAAWIGLFGGVAGLFLGWLLSLGLNQIVLLILRWQDIPVEGRFFITTPGLAFLALFFGAAVGILAGLMPAGRAARLNPIEALRYE
jgi:ABC-type antimicrobial peptide transport system permease subunit